MTIESKKEDGKLNLKLTGTLDSLGSPDLEAKLAEELTDDVKELILNFAGVDYISSRGLRVLVSTHRKMQGRPMHLENVNDNVKEVLRLSGLLKVFTD